jgi:pyruvate/2-oxoglutarate dehydrogenase complex dihydrolipoamide dehydrogenase (E3) component
MAVDYDLIVIGATPAGMAAAKAAARYQSRVALVTQGETGSDLPIAIAYWQMIDRARSEWPLANNQLANEQLANEQLADYQRLLQQQRSQDATDGLAGLGIDVIDGKGGFVRSARAPRLRLAIANRDLTARAYLLALGSAQPDDAAESIDRQQLATIDVWTTANFTQRLAQLATLKSLVIVGTSPNAIAIAQLLVRRGVRVTIVTTAARILPAAEWAVVALLQTQIQVDGVELLLNTRVEQVTARDRQVWVETADQTIVAEALMLGSERLDYAPLTATELNLAAAGGPNDRIVSGSPGRATRQIYLCPDAADTDQAIALVEQALLVPWQSTRSPIPVIVVASNPSLVSIGLTVSAAKRQFGRDVLVLQQSTQSLLAAQLQSTTTGLCQLVVRSNGQILGAHILAPQAEDWSAVLQLAIQQNLTVQALADCSFARTGWLEIIQNLAREYRFSQVRSGWRRHLLESWFAWLRDRMR